MTLAHDMGHGAALPHCLPPSQARNVGGEFGAASQERRVPSAEAGVMPGVGAVAQAGAEPVVIRPKGSGAFLRCPLSVCIRKGTAGGRARGRRGPARRLGHQSCAGAFGGRCACGCAGAGEGLRALRRAASARRRARRTA
ncbi:hypothetical protein GCM10010365_51100 [Streptomyces poonensis]|uniref:Uncharacterized protein n=1 Tax=Streptomyces poonensis TaxID=68255 RepID=A0A918UPD3_9ACTN|nr:hypothetical protein GCM10010365_51100 [Streptomyces poonensis]